MREINQPLIQLIDSESDSEVILFPGFCGLLLCVESVQPVTKDFAGD